VKTILVAVDGSDHSNRAVELAADIAVKYDAKLVLVHAIDSRPLTDGERRLAEAEYADRIGTRMADSGIVDSRATGPGGVGPIFKQYAETGLVIRTALGEGLLDGASQDARERGVTNVETLLENGEAADVVLDIAEKQKANLIVIGSRGQGDLKSLLLGSVSHKVANRSDINVITVK